MVEQITYEQRLAAIARADRSIDHHHALREAALLEYDITGDLGAKGLADRHELMRDYAQRLKADMIQGRSTDHPHPFNGDDA